jgi:hypothetical protein
MSCVNLDFRHRTISGLLMTNGANLTANAGAGELCRA